VLIQISGQNEGQPSPSVPNTVVLQFLTIDLLPKAVMHIDAVLLSFRFCLHRAEAGARTLQPSI
jgi:hypothetical protein